MANKSVGLLTIAFGADLRGFDRAMKKATRTIGNFGKKMSNIGRNLTAGLTLPILGVGIASIKLASDTQESLNKVDVAFGDSAQSVKDFAKTTTTAFGIAQKDALEMLSLFGDMSTSLGFSQASASKMSKELVGLAGDLASFKNIQVDVAQTALAGIFTGETEALKKLGIMTTEATLKETDYFLSLGKTWKQLTMQEKIMVRYAAVLDQAQNATGDFVRTQDSFANQSRQLQSEIKDLGAELGEALLPIATKLVAKVRDLVKEFKGLSDEKKTLILKIAGVAAILGPVLLMFGSFVTIVVNGVVPAILLFSKAMVILGNTISKNKILNIIAIVGALGYEMATAAGLIEKFTIEGEDTNAIMKESEKTISATSKEIENLQNNLGKVDFSNLLGGTGEGPMTGEEAFAIDKEKLEKSYREITNSIKQEYLGMTDGIITTEEQMQDALYSSQLGHLEDMKALYQRYGLDVSAIDNELSDLLISNRERQTEAIFNWDEALTQAGESIGASLSQGAEDLSQFGSMVKSVIKDTIGAIIAEGVALAITAALRNSAMFGTTPWMIPIIAGLAAGLARTAFNSLIPSFADGGIVSGPTVGLMGEYAGARTNPEVIAPLDKLKSMMGGTNQQVEVVGRIAGNDIWLSNSKATFNRYRSA